MLGVIGERWYAELDAAVDAYASEWGFSVGVELEGGTHAFVAEAVTAAGTPAVFKYALPDLRGSGDHDKELRTVVAAQHAGYVQVLAYDLDNRAVLMERLGATLSDSGLSVDERIDDGTYRMIDPDPMVAEPAADLAVPMRDWNAQLRATGDPLAAAISRCQRISDLTGVDPQPIWEWGFMERLSSSLYCQTLGIEDWPRDGYPVVEACVGVTTI